MGLGGILNQLGGLFGGGDPPVSARSFPGLGSGGVGGGPGPGVPHDTSDPAALGNLLAPLGNLGAPGGQKKGQAGIMDMLNREKLNLTSFLGQGGGVRNAQQIAAGQEENALSSDTNFGRFLAENNPNRQAALDAREGLGPGGGLGVFSNVPDFLQENDPGLEYLKGTPFWKKLLGGLAKVGGGLFAPMTGGASLVAGNAAAGALSGPGEKRTYRIGG